MKAILLTFLVIVNSSIVFAGNLESKQRFLTRLLDTSIENSISVERSVSSLLKQYPEFEEIILDTAFENYPEHYRQVIRGAFNANPAFSEDIIRLALEHNVDSCDKIIIAAIKAEPAYADDILAIASKLHPDDKEHLFITALKTKPVMMNSIVDSTLDSNPSDFGSYLTMALEQLPEMFIKIVNHAFTNYPSKSEEVVEVAVNCALKANHNENVRKIIDSAIASGLNKDVAVNAAIKGGAEPALLARF